MTKKTQRDETQTQFTLTGRRLSQRLKTVPSHLKETTFLESVAKSESQSKRISTRTKNPPQIQSSSTNASSKKENTCQANDTIELKGTKRRNKSTTVHQDAHTHPEEEEKEELVTMGSRGSNEFQHANIITEEVEKPVKRRRLRKLHQTTITIDQKEGEEASKRTNNDNLTIKNDKHNLLQLETTPMCLRKCDDAQAKNCKSKQGLSRMDNSKRRNSNSKYSLIDEQEDKDTLLQSNFTVHEDIGKNEYKDRRNISDDNNDVSNQLHYGVVSDDDIQHEDNKKSPIPINTLQSGKREWTIKVMVIRRGSVEKYNTQNGSGTRWKIILMDEQETSIDAIAFNEVIDAMEHLFVKGNTYFLSNGNRKLINKEYPHTHDMLEIFLTEQTKVEEATQAIHLERLPYASIGINNLKNYVFQSTDVFGIVSKVDSELGLAQDNMSY